jgi:hypothetical protein
VLPAVIEPGRGLRRHLVAGNFISFPDLIRTLGELSGRRIRFAISLRWFLAAFGRAADGSQTTAPTRKRAPPPQAATRR